MTAVYRALAFLTIVVALLASVSGCTEGTATAERTEFTAPEMSDEQLRELIDDVLHFTYTGRRLNLTQHAAWQILHGALPYGTKYYVYNGDQPVPAIDWVLEGNPMNGWTVRHGTEDLDGRRGLKMVLESGSKTGQGHEDQWLAVISQSGYPSDHPVIFQGVEYQIGDIVRQAMYDVFQGKECSWTIIGLTNYLGPEYFTENKSWENFEGQQWNLERMIAMEAGEDLHRSACGGTHRLIGMIMALKRYQRETGKSDAELTGGWRAAREKIERAFVAAKEFQNPDACFSTNYFVGPAMSSDLGERINKSGHTLEVLALGLDDERIEEHWVTHAVINLCNLFNVTRELQLECGGLYHATHGLMEYRERRFGPWDYPVDEIVGLDAAQNTATEADGASAEPAEIPAPATDSSAAAAARAPISR
ncbi:MAG: ADP-ribosylation factor-directed GTPase activating protein isoform b [Planctomycetota bacterium]|nr:MAG: ADP-ribosylation factor-directed GTPase activating protein isoform b [Planctomycetota bacterium]